ncbi:MAG: 4-hydroxyphenylacetate 3-hydroxylase N-terminal domain-containing protein [Thermodesulfobacteriota bacterium]
MALMDGSRYKKSLADLNLCANVMGKKAGCLTENPLVAPSVSALSATYDAAHAPADKDLFVVRSSLSGAPVNRFAHLFQSPEDLVAKVTMQRRCGNITGCCFQRCVGMDASNAVFSVTYECDAARKTEYHQRFLDFWKNVQEKDLAVAGAMTDPKGDRSRRPADQSDPDLFLRVVEKRRDGIVVRGAKLHQTGLLNSHEMIVMPTMALRPGEEQFCVSFALPTNTKGLRYLYGRQASDTRKAEIPSSDAGNPSFGGQEVMVVFDDVFVPEERVFLLGETEFAGSLVERFASYHRQSYGGCKVGVGDVLIGATALIAEMNGVANASHVKDKIVEMIHLNETMFACGIACSALGKATAAGNYLPDLLLANVCKQNVTRFPFELARFATDIAGGLLGTLPAAAELDDAEAGPLLRKYLAAAPGFPTEERMRTLRFIENLTVGAGAVAYLVESMHGAGPPMAQRIMISRQANLEAKKNLARKIMAGCD